MPILLSKASKMPGKSWSLQAGDTCPGSINPLTKEVIEVCADCYAKSGFYRMDNVKAPRLSNRKDWKRPDWADDMVAALDNERWFRWFDSGDVYHPALAFKIFLVMQKTPHVQHWLPTKSYKIPRIRAILERMKLLPNVAVRFSSDSMTGEFDADHGSTVIPFADSVTSASKVCDAYERSGKCGDCRACWSKEVAVVAYPAHGRRMGRIVKELAA